MWPRTSKAINATLPSLHDRNPVCLMSLALLRQLCQHATARVSITYRRHSRTVTYFSSSRRYRPCGNSSLSIPSTLTKASTRSSSSPFFRRAAATVGATSIQPGSVALQDDEPLEWDEEALAPEAEPEGVLVLPPPSHSRVKTADFVKSSTAVSQCPPAKHPEFAVIGRSNVGKSSLINMLTGRKALAQISKTPGRTLSQALGKSDIFAMTVFSICLAGKTKCINHFIINNSWFLVDLPGYG